MTLDYRNSHLVLRASDTPEGRITWQSPSNLALVKYWGKYGQQMPRNPSISITLDAACTRTTIGWRPREDTDGAAIRLNLRFEGREEPAFEARIARFLESLLGIYPFLRQLHLEVDTSNSFPHSSGIASSASAMSALALGLCSMEQRFFGQPEGEADFLRKASYLARLGSGSACRSLFPYFASWGAHGDLPGSADEYGTPAADGVHDSFRTLRNAILIVSSGSKAVSSSAGHQLMEAHPYAAVRYAQAGQRLSQLIPVLRQGDWEAFGHLVEDEALTLHALMMASRPSYILMKPQSLALIERLRAYRREKGSAVCFSLDAGPNLHVLYPESEAAAVEAFLQAECLPLCEGGQWIADRAGAGPVLLEA